MFTRHPLRWTAGALVALCSTLLTHPASAEIGDLVADGVIGQSTFDDSVALPIGPQAFGTPKGIAIDRSVTPNRVYVSDSVYHRVLGWADVDALANGAPADIVLGQPDAASWGCNNVVVFDGVPPAPTLSSMCGPAGLAVDASGNLYVADSINCRVLVFRDPFGTDGVADAVLGESVPGFQGCGVSATKLYEPMGVAVDGAGNAFVADTLNCRVLEFDSPLTTDSVADRVYGQTSFTGRNCSGANLYFPSGVSVDADERLYVSSSLYVLSEFDHALTTDTIVDRVIGTGQCNPGGETSATTCGILSGATDAAGRLYIADSGNSRVLAFNNPAVNVLQASRVFGQSGFTGTSDLLHDGCNTGGASATSLCLRKVRFLTLGATFDEAGALTLDDAGRLWVADGLNNRVLRYDTPLTSATANLVLGQQSMSETHQPVFAVEQPQTALFQSYALVLEPAASRLLVYSNYSYARATPLAVIGQPDFTTVGCNAAGLSSASLCGPRGVSVDASGNLWIADTDNNRVLEFASPWINYDYNLKRYVVKATADYVYGQLDTTSNACAAGATGLCAPLGVASEPTHSRLYIADSGNNRIVRHDNPLADATADAVIGQSDFAGVACNAGGLGASSLCEPAGLAVDADELLWVADSGNNRVLAFAPQTAAAQIVLGQPGMGSASPAVGAGGLSGPVGIATDRRGNVYVADRDNNRVLEYDAPASGDALADRVFGQPDFATTACTASDHGLCQPVGVAEQYYYDDTLAVADGGNNRVLLFDSPFCVDDYLLTAANRTVKMPRSKPLKAKLRVYPGLLAPGETLVFSGKLVLLDEDGGIYPGESPLMSILTASGALVHAERVPDLSNIRLGANSETWGTEYLKGERDAGVDDFTIKEKFRYPAHTPNYAQYTYKGRALGLPTRGFDPAMKWRIQWGGTCFTTDLTCTGGACKVAK